MADPDLVVVGAWRKEFPDGYCSESYQEHAKHRLIFIWTARIGDKTQTETQEAPASGHTFVPPASYPKKIKKALQPYTDLRRKAESVAKKSAAKAATKLKASLDRSLTTIVCEYLGQESPESTPANPLYVPDVACWTPGSGRIAETVVAFKWTMPLSERAQFGQNRKHIVKGILKDYLRRGVPLPKSTGTLNRAEDGISDAVRESTFAFRRKYPDLAHSLCMRLGAWQIHPQINDEDGSCEPPPRKRARTKRSPSIGDAWPEHYKTRVSIVNAVIRDSASRFRAGLSVIPQFEQNEWRWRAVADAGYRPVWFLWMWQRTSDQDYWRSAAI